MLETKEFYKEILAHTRILIDSIDFSKEVIVERDLDNLDQKIQDLNDQVFMILGKQSWFKHQISVKEEES